MRAVEGEEEEESEVETFSSSPPRPPPTAATATTVQPRPQVADASQTPGSIPLIETALIPLRKGAEK